MPMDNAIIVCYCFDGGGRGAAVALLLVALLHQKCIFSKIGI